MSSVWVRLTELQTPDTKLLGWQIQGARGVISPTRERGWKLRLALPEIVRRGRASGRDIERLVGHATFVALLRREVLSVFASVYTFARRHYERPTRIWPSFARELRLFADQLPLVFWDVKATWSPDVIATDASEWGLGAVMARADPEVIGRTGRLCERWCFRLGGDIGRVRFHAGLDADAASFGIVSGPEVNDRQTLASFRQMREDSPPDSPLSRGVPPHEKGRWADVPPELLRGPWKLVGRSKWKHKEHINV